MTDILRIDIVSLFDLDFEKQRARNLDRTLRMLARAPQDEYVGNLYAESFGWVFYGDSLPGFERFSLGATEGIQSSRGVSVLIHRQRSVGVCSVWQTFSGSADPLEIKQNSGQIFPETHKLLERFGLKLKEVERQYPFIGIQVNTEDIAKYCSDHAEELGRVFTGNLEWEDKPKLKSYIQNNLSGREYERLFLRWTEGLGVYANVSSMQYEKSLFRAIQIFETCIAVRRLMRNVTQGVDELSGKLIIWPGPLLQSFLETQHVLVSNPPVVSVEAERLLGSAYRSFGIYSLVKSTRESCDFLEQRFQWFKAQALAFVGVFTYLVDTLRLYLNK